jgi:hypothetical protein
MERLPPIEIAVTGNGAEMSYVFSDVRRLSELREG